MAATPTDRITLRRLDLHSIGMTGSVTALGLGGWTVHRIARR